VGNTPSTVSIAPGQHAIVVKKKGYADWSRSMHVSGSAVHRTPIWMRLRRVFSRPYYDEIVVWGSLVTDFDRITHNPAVMVGKACIRGMRVTVEMIVGQLGSGTTVEELLGAYPYLEREDVMQAVRYAAWMASGREVELASA
jgi:uncharacterized protein (DUF433 family)